MNNIVNSSNTIVFFKKIYLKIVLKCDKSILSPWQGEFCIKNIVTFVGGIVANNYWQVEVEQFVG